MIGTSVAADKRTTAKPARGILLGMSPSTAAELDAVLRAVSRSFYLTLKAVPRRVRRQIGLGYLFCRAADTIADTRLLPAAERLEHLATLRAQFGDSSLDAAAVRRIGARVGEPQAVPKERELLCRLEDCFAVLETFSSTDRALISRLVRTLTQGLEMDLERFPSEESGEIEALDSDDELDRYCYYVAGCVGEFWTDLCVTHLPALRAWDLQRMRELGVRFGKGLQMTNILRDVDSDLGIGRCYLPAPRLAAVGWTARELRDAVDRSRVRPVILDLLAHTMEHYECGREYAAAIPRRVVSLRLACSWPLLIGLRTLALIAAADDPCAPGVVRKISRREVHRTLRASTARVWSNRRLDALWTRWAGAVWQHLEPREGESGLPGSVESSTRVR